MSLLPADFSIDAIDLLIGAASRDSVSSLRCFGRRAAERRATNHSRIVLQRDR
jgi:hypothetical protein